MKSFLILISATALLASATHGATVITPTGVTATTTLRSSNPIGSTIDGSGLSGGGASADVLSEIHAFASTGSNDFYWLSGRNAGKGANEVLTFTLEADYTISEVHLWQYALENDGRRQIATATLTFSSDGTNFGNPVVFNPSGYVGTDPIPVQTFSFAPVSGVTHIQMLVENNSDFVGLSEVRFGGVIPEPSIALLGGFGLLALLRRRR